MKNTVNTAIPGLVLSLVLLCPLSAGTQIAPDSSLGNERSIVIPNQLIKRSPSEVISGGAVRTDSLFHSFSQFNVPLGRGAYFSNPAGIANILTRVTGNTPSNLFGTIGVLGNANLFFLNPNGVVFGPNAKLDLSGSFLASTADAFSFQDGSQFSAIEPAQPPLLSVTLPAGLTYSGRSGKIEVQGPGHAIRTSGGVAGLFISDTPIPFGLRVMPGKTLALIGGEVQFTGGVATALDGGIEIGAVQLGEAVINQVSNTGLSVSYENAKTLSDIGFTKLSLLNSSGLGSGNIHLFGRNITFADKSLAFITSQGFSKSGRITINAAESLTLSGTSQFTPLYPGLSRLLGNLVSVTQDGKGADITVAAKNLVLKNEARILSGSLGSGVGGDIAVNASDSVQVLGVSPFDPKFPLSSLIASYSSGTAKAGNIRLSTGNLTIQNGAQVVSSSFRGGTAGDVLVDAKAINLLGFNPNSLIGSLLSSVTQGFGDGGNVLVNTNQLTLQEGGRVDASSLAFGDAGSVTINARDFVRVSGKIPGSINSSLIISAANKVDPVIREGLGLPEIPTGSSGNVTVRTKLLEVLNGAQITVRNDGPADAGTLALNADAITLDQGGITASTAGGDGGNIDLKFDSLLLLRNGSSITASALGNGDGGNIVIDPDLVVLLGGSQISANADQGSGGLVSITTKGLFVSPDSSISAISNSGVEFNGIVELNTPNQDFAKAATLPAPAPQAPETSSVCQGRPGGEPGQFVKAGTGGIPRSSNDLLNKRSWREQPSAAAVQAAVLDNPADPEVQGWIIYPDRTMQFVTEPGVFYSTTATLPCRSTTVNR